MAAKPSLASWQAPSLRCSFVAWYCRWLQRRAWQHLCLHWKTHVTGWQCAPTHQAVKTESAKLGGLDGVCTFSEFAVPLTARLAEKLGVPGNSPEAVDHARDKVRRSKAQRSPRGVCACCLATAAYTQPFGTGRSPGGVALCSAQASPSNATSSPRLHPAPPR